MRVTACKTPKIQPGDNLLDIISVNLPKISEKDIVVVTSKIVSICQGRVIPNGGSVDKHKLIRKEADFYIEPQSSSSFDVTLTIKNNILIANAGIDESNGNNNFILWPSDPFREAFLIWEHLKKTYDIRYAGVIITDSRITPLRWGTIGIGIAWCGIEPLNTYIGKPDIFGRNLRMTKASILDGLAASAVVVMGEGNEQTPLAIIKDTPLVKFTGHPPTQREIDILKIKLSDDIYAPLVDSDKWRKGGA